MKTTLLLDMVADVEGDRVAVDDLSYSELCRRAKAAANILLESPTEQLAFIGVNGWLLPALLFASGYAGLPFCPLNFRLTDDRLNRLVARTSPSIVVVDDDMIGRIADHPGVIVLRRSDIEARLAAPDAIGLPDTAERDGEIAVLLFTSGTTGEPKAAVLRHENLTSYVISTVEFLGASPDEASLVSVPAYHIAAISAILTGLYGGRRIVYLPMFEPRAWVQSAISSEVTHAMIVPTMLQRILETMAEIGTALPALRSLSYGGGRMPGPVIEQAMAALPNVDFVNAYGLTETSSTIALLSAEDHRVAFAATDPEIRRRFGSVGRPLPEVEIEIRGDDGTTVLPPLGKGEIYVRGPQVAGEYLGRSMLDSEGWFATKDAGWMDEDGFLFVEGRLDDVIVRGGENISPGEVEDCLRTHPSVEDVAVIGLPSVQWGEQIAAVVVLKREEAIQNLADHVRSLLRSTKTPECWFVEQELPYNETGKLLRRALREKFAGETDRTA